MDKLPEPLRNIAKVITPHIKGYSYPSLLQKKPCGKWYKTANAINIVTDRAAILVKKPKDIQIPPRNSVNAIK